MSDIITERSGAILHIQFNRPAQKNAMTSAMYTNMADILNDANKDDTIRVVLWSGAGDAFCAGTDAVDFLKNPPSPSAYPMGQLMDAFVAFEKPFVAAVQGAAIGGGTTMLTHCDFVYAGESAKFQLSFINLGLVPECGSSHSIPARVGHLRAAELYLLGEPFTAARAAEIGLVTRVVADADLLATATKTAQKLAAKPHGALLATRRLIKQASIGEIKAAMEIENQEFMQRVTSADAKEALSAFLEKRPPKFAA